MPIGLHTHGSQPASQPRAHAVANCQSWLANTPGPKAQNKAGRRAAYVCTVYIYIPAMYCVLPAPGRSHSPRSGTRCGDRNRTAHTGDPRLPTYLTAYALHAQSNASERPTASPRTPAPGHHAARLPIGNLRNARPTKHHLSKHHRHPYRSSTLPACCLPTRTGASLPMLQPA